MAKTYVTILLILLVLSGGLAGCTQKPREPKPRDDEIPPVPTVTREAMEIVTAWGNITVMLYPEAAPKTVELMKTYIREGYYRGREFNRVVPTHVIQLVDKAGGATDDARRVPLETHPRYHFSAGAAGIARDTDPNSGGPEFFIMDYATSHLDGAYTVWGQVVGGLDLVHRAARVEAVELRDVPVANMFLMDRMAIEPLVIQDVQLVNVVLLAEEAALYPKNVATNFRQGDYRHSLDFPQHVHQNNTTRLTWYVRPYNGSAVPEENKVQILVDGIPHAVRVDLDAEGAYHWYMRPMRSGNLTAEFAVSGSVIGRLTIPVEPPRDEKSSNAAPG